MAAAGRNRAWPAGVSALVLLCWERHGRRDILVLACVGMNDQMETIALQPGPTDEGSLILRAGPDAPDLRNVTATVF